MRINRTAHKRFFTTLGNEVLRENRLSFCARGILAYLLSLPDGERIDIRTLAERTPEGRERVASALRELERHGYLHRTVKRTSAGKIYTDLELFDTPTEASTLLAPQSGIPGSDSSGIKAGGDQPLKEQGEETTLPHESESAPAPAPEPEKPGREGADADAKETAKSVAVLARVSRNEPRLSLGLIEAATLAPLVTEWRRRGASDLHIIGTLTAGLPKKVYSPTALVRDRLTRKMPAERVKAQIRAECGECGDPIAAAGLCRRCQLRQQPGPDQSEHWSNRAQACARGVALVRAALRGIPVAVVAPA